jgi:hypothetical protein
MVMATRQQRISSWFAPIPAGDPYRRTGIYYLSGFVVTVAALVTIPDNFLSRPQLSPSISSIVMLLTWFMVASLVLTGLALLNPKTRARLKEGRSRADQFVDGAISRWETEGRLTATRALRLRAELAEPQFHAVLPHFGVHLTISAILRFPFGSMARAGYTFGSLLLGNVRYLIGRIDRAAWHRSNQTHSPLVLVCAAIPGFGAFAYLASSPVRAHPLLLRVGLDSMLQKIPWDLYERAGLRSVVASAPVAEPFREKRKDMVVSISARPHRVIRALGIASIILFLADVAVAVLDSAFDHPTIMGWTQTARVLDLNKEASLGTWLTVTCLLTLAALFAVSALGDRSMNARFTRHWWGLAVIAIGLSIDEQAQLHDPGGGMGAWARERLPLEGLLYVGWVIFAVVSIALLGYTYRHFFLNLPATTRAGLLGAAMLYVTGEVGVEMLGGWWIDSRGRGLTTELLTSVEEFLGLMGLVLAISALLGYVRDQVGEVRLRLTSSESAVEAAGARSEVVAPSLVQLSHPWPRYASRSELKDASTESA